MAELSFRNTEGEMQAIPSPVQVVSLPAVARILMDAESRRWLLPFFARSCSVSEAARLIGASPNSVLYRVQAWCRLGLLEVQATEQRRGRAVRLYRSVADEFFVPHHVTHTQDLLEFLQFMNQPYLDALYQGLIQAGQQVGAAWGVQFSRPSPTLYRIQPALGPGMPWNPLALESPPILDNFHDDLYLDHDDAKALQAALLAVIDQYRGRRGSAAYICYIALAPTSK